MKKIYTYLFAAMALVATLPSMAQDCLVSASVTVVEPQCGLANGSVHINATGGVLPYTYYFDEVVTGADISNVAAGGHSYWVQDAVNCWAKGGLDLGCQDNCHFKTFTQGGWGAVPQGGNPGVYMTAHFAGAFPSGLNIGCTRILRLTTAQAVTDFLPSGSTPKKLQNALYLNPGGGYSNVLAGQLVAATLSVTFDALDPNFSLASGTLANGIITSGTFAGWTVADLLNAANQFIGNCASPYTAAQFNEALTAFNQNYDNGTTDNGFVICVKKDEKRMTNMTPNMDFSMFPNPANDQVIVNAQLPMPGMGTLIIQDVTGRVVKQQMFTSTGANMQAIALDVSDLNVGTYMVSMQFNNTARTSRLVLTH